MKYFRAFNSGALRQQALTATASVRYSSTESDSVRLRITGHTCSWTSDFLTRPCSRSTRRAAWLVFRAWLLESDKNLTIIGNKCWGTTCESLFLYSWQYMAMCGICSMSSARTLGSGGQKEKKLVLEIVAYVKKNALIRDTCVTPRHSYQILSKIRKSILKWHRASLD